MALYLITYDVNVNHKNEYEPLWKKLGDMGAKKILDSVWILYDPSELRAKPIATDLNSHFLRTGDRLLVIEVGKDAGCTDLIDMTANELLHWLIRARF